MPYNKNSEKATSLRQKMSRTTKESKKVLSGVVEFSNGYPVSLNVKDPFQFELIRSMQDKYSQALGYPVIFVNGFVSDQGYQISMYHPDSVLKDDGWRSGFSLPSRPAEVVGLWDGECVTSLIKLLSAREQDLFFSNDYNSRFVALQNQRIGPEDLHDHPIGIDESKFIRYFRDKNNRGFVIRDTHRWCTQEIILAPTLKTLLDAMVTCKDSTHRVSGIRDIEDNVKSTCISILHSAEIDEKIQDFNNGTI